MTLRDLLEGAALTFQLVNVYGVTFEDDVRDIFRGSAEIALNHVDLANYYNEKAQFYVSDNILTICISKRLEP